MRQGAEHEARYRHVPPGAGRLVPPIESALVDECPTSARGSADRLRPAVVVSVVSVSSMPGAGELRSHAPEARRAGITAGRRPCRRGQATFARRPRGSTARAADRQWFKSRQGLAATETPRDLSFCGYAILDDRILSVPDASVDPRFFANPLVLADPRIRFYAGCPITGPAGAKLGTTDSIDDMLCRADAMMYAAKQQTVGT